MNASSFDGLVARASAFLDAQAGRRQVNRILHGFPSPRLWEPAHVSVPDVLARRAAWQQESPAPFDLYVGVPFCVRTDPDRCGYCLFPVEVFSGSPQFDTYLDYLEREGRLFQRAFEGVAPRAIYIGGGTPNLMRPAQYLRLMRIVREMFPALAPGTPITLEGIPQLFTREKLASMKEAGVTRVSIGVQQVNAELNALSGRKQTRQQVFDAIAWCHELGLPCNADLIFGWPRQTMASMLDDLTALVESGVEHLAHYELNIGGPTDFSLNRRHELPSPAETREMYQVATAFLTDHGYRQLTAYDFQRDPVPGAFVYEECDRGFDRHELWGWGFAGVSDFGGSPEEPGWSYLNHRKVEDYYRALDRGEFPVERGIRRSAADLQLHTLFRNLQGLRVDRASYRRRFGSDVVEDFAPAWQALAVRGWCVVDDAAIRLIGDGAYYVPLIQELISQERVEQLREASVVRHLVAPPERRPVARVTPITITPRGRSQ